MLNHDNAFIRDYQGNRCIFLEIFYYFSRLCLQYYVYLCKLRSSPPARKCSYYQRLSYRFCDCFLIAHNILRISRMIMSTSVLITSRYMVLLDVIILFFSGDASAWRSALEQPSMQQTAASPANHEHRAFRSNVRSRSSLQGWYQERQRRSLPSPFLLDRRWCTRSAKLWIRITITAVLHTDLP